jgi:hypothetical protein
LNYRSTFLQPTELDAYRKVGEHFFPDVDWSRGIRRVAQLLGQHPEGIFCLWQGSAILGYMTLWPLRAEAAPALENGELRDDDIDAKWVPGRVRPPHSTWIMTAIAVVPSNKTARREIILLLLNFLKTSQAANWPCAIYAHAVTADGLRFCRRTGFEFLFPRVANLCCLRRL